MLYLGSIGMDHVISEPCYKGTILQRNYRKMTKIPCYTNDIFNKFDRIKLVYF